MSAGSDNNYDGGVSLESSQKLKKPVIMITTPLWIL